MNRIKLFTSYTIEGSIPNIVLEVLKQKDLIGNIDMDITYCVKHDEENIIEFLNTDEIKLYDYIFILIPNITEDKKEILYKLSMVNTKIIYNIKYDTCNKQYTDPTTYSFYNWFKDTFIHNDLLKIKYEKLFLPLIFIITYNLTISYRRLNNIFESKGVNYIISNMVVNNNYIGEKIINDSKNN